MNASGPKTRLSSSRSGVLHSLKVQPHSPNTAVSLSKSSLLQPINGATSG